MLGAQDVIIRVVQPVDQERLCPDQSVTFECHIPGGSSFLQWVVGDELHVLRFSLNEMMGDTENSSDGTLLATLTNRSSDSSNEFGFFTSTLLIQPPLDGLNNTIVKCQGNNYVNVENQTTLTLSGKSLCVHNYK